MALTNKQRANGEHILNIKISYEFKMRLRKLADRYDRTTADMVRSLLKIGIPVMEGISEAEEKLLNEYVGLFRKFRQVKRIKEI